MTCIRHELHGPFHVLSLYVQKHVEKPYFLFTDEESEGQYKIQNKMKAITRTVHCHLQLSNIRDTDFQHGQKEKPLLDTHLCVVSF